MWYCLPDSLSLLVYNPETASRVTLALLGTVFQTKLPTTDNQTPTTYHYIFLFIDILFLNQTSRQENSFLSKNRKTLSEPLKSFE